MIQDQRVGNYLFVPVAGQFDFLQVNIIPERRISAGHFHEQKLIAGRRNIDKIAVVNV